MSQIHVKENSKRIWILHTSQCTRFYKSNPHIYMIRGLKVACINFHMFIGMVKETLKDKKWSMGSKESAAGQGKAIQSAIHLEWGNQL